MAVKVEIDLAIVICELLIWGILFALPFCFYKLWQKIRSQLSKDDLKWYSIVIGFSLVVIGIIDIFYVFYDVIPGSGSSKLEATTNLTAALITAISVLGAGIGYFYTKRQDKIQEIHAEGEWRRRLFDLEGQDEYKISDLMQLASLIDIVPKKSKTLALYVNRVIIEILIIHGAKVPDKTRLNDCENKTGRLDVADSEKLRTGVARILKLNVEDDNPLGNIVYDYDITNLKDVKLTHPEENEIRRCIHALLKDDWENVTN